MFFSFQKLKLLLSNDWSTGGSSLAAIGTMALTPNEILEWFPWLSQEAAYALPLLGVVLLLLQIYFKLKEPKD